MHTVLTIFLALQFVFTSNLDGRILAAGTHETVPVTRVRLASHLRQIGVTEGGVLMVHVRLSAFGWVVGGWIRSCTPSVTPLERPAR